VWMHVNSNCRT